jgi:hypothetical protein
MAVCTIAMLLICGSAPCPADAVAFSATWFHRSTGEHASSLPRAADESVMVAPSPIASARGNTGLNFPNGSCFDISCLLQPLASERR